MPAARLFICSLLVSGCFGCATTGELAEPRDNDPFERANRAIFKFNRTADRLVLRPVANGYHTITPDPVERRVGNFFDNLSSPIVIASDLLQGKFKQAGADTGRFLLNSTAGLLGLFDVASRVGLDEHDEDFGQAFGRWGIGRGPYVMMPLFGPYSLREGIGRLLELPLEPLKYYDSDRAVRNTLVLMYYIDRRTALLAADDELDNAFDAYLFLRDAYYQRRRYLLHDGDPPSLDEEFENDYSEEEFLGEP